LQMSYFLARDCGFEAEALLLRQQFPEARKS
jgi:hypothetical protein